MVYQFGMIWTIPNSLTVLRLLAAPGVAIMFLYFHRPWADWLALTLFVGRAEAMAKARGHLILTPHPGELGRLLGQGLSLSEAQRQVGRVCDGPSMVEKAYALCQHEKLRMPLCGALHRFIAGDHDQKGILAQLFGSENHSE